MRLQWKQSGRAGIWFWVSVILSVAGPTWSAADPGATPAAKTENKADAVLRAMAKHLSQSDSFRVEVSSTIWVRQGLTRWQQHKQVTLTAHRPNRFALISEQESRQIAIVSTGNQITIFVPELNQYIVKKAPASFDDMFGADVQLGRLAETAIPLLTMILSRHPYEKLMEQTTETEYVQATEIDGIKCHHIKIKYSETDLNLWITAEKEPQLRRLSPDLTLVLEQARHERPDIGLLEVEQWWDFTDWRMNINPQDKPFEFIPPPGAELTDSFEPRRKGARLHPTVGQKSPDFDIALVNGGRATLQSHLGRDIVVLDFWSLRCSPCRVALPLLDKLAGEYRDNGVVFYTINAEDNAERIKAYLTSADLKLSAALDVSGKITGRYGVQYLPHTVVIDKDGIIKAVHVGFVQGTDRQLGAELDILLAGKELTHSTYDLTCEQVSFQPGTIKNGDKVSFSCVLANHGTGPVARSSYNIQLEIDGNVIYSGPVDVAIPAAGTAEWSVPPNNWHFQLLQDGTYRYRMMVDTYDQYIESNERNNTVEGRLEIKSRG